MNISASEFSFIPIFLYFLLGIFMYSDLLFKGYSLESGKPCKRFTAFIALCFLKLYAFIASHLYIDFFYFPV